MMGISSPEIVPAVREQETKSLFMPTVFSEKGLKKNSYELKRFDSKSPFIEENQQVGKCFQR